MNLRSVCRGYTCWLFQSPIIRGGQQIDTRLAWCTGLLETSNLEKNNLGLLYWIIPSDTSQDLKSISKSTKKWEKPSFVNVLSLQENTELGELIKCTRAGKNIL